MIDGFSKKLRRAHKIHPIVMFYTLFIRPSHLVRYFYSMESFELSRDASGPRWC